MGNSTYHTSDHSHFWRKKIPELARGLGMGLNEFRKAKKEIKDEVESVKED